MSYLKGIRWTYSYFFLLWFWEFYMFGQPKTVDNCMCSISGVVCVCGLFINLCFLVLCNAGAVSSCSAVVSWVAVQWGSGAVAAAWLSFWLGSCAAGHADSTTPSARPPVCSQGRGASRHLKIKEIFKRTKYVDSTLELYGFVELWSLHYVV